MKSIRIGVGALIVALATYGGAGLADAGQAGSRTSQREKQTGTTHHHETSKNASTATRAKRRVASGEVKAIDAKALTLANGEQLRLGRTTEFMDAGKKISRQDVKQGERVRASYEPRGKLAYADRVDVVSTKPAAKPGRRGANER